MSSCCCLHNHIYIGFLCLLWIRSHEISSFRSVNEVALLTLVSPIMFIDSYSVLSE